MNIGFKTLTPRWTVLDNTVTFPGDITYIFKVDVAFYREEIADTYTTVLSKDELEKASRYSQSSDAARFLCGRYLLRKMLSIWFNIAPHEVKINYAGTGKLFSEGVEYNISHSGNYVILAVSTYAVGVDIELIRDLNHTSISDAIFCTDEVDVIQNSRVKLQDFFVMWTRKEALLKATGEGLVDELKSVNCLRRTTKRNGELYEVTSILIDKQYAASIAINNVRENEIRYIEI